MTGIIELLIIIAIIGVIAWGLTQLPMPQVMKTVIIVAAALFCLLLVLRSLGGIDVQLAP